MEQLQVLEDRVGELDPSLHRQRFSSSTCILLPERPSPDRPPRVRCYLRFSDPSGLLLGQVGAWLATFLRFAWEHRALIAAGVCLAFISACGVVGIGMFALDEVQLYGELGGGIWSWGFLGGTLVNGLRAGALAVTGIAVGAAEVSAAESIEAAAEGSIPSYYADAVDYAPWQWRAIRTAAEAPGITADAYCGVVGSSRC